MAADQRRSPRITPKSAQEWGSVAPQWLGVFGLLAQLVLWGVTAAATGHGVYEPAFLTAFGGLIVAGQGVEAVVRLKQPPDAPDPMERTTDG